MNPRFYGNLNVTVPLFIYHLKKYIVRFFLIIFLKKNPLPFSFSFVYNYTNLFFILKTMKKQETITLASVIFICLTILGITWNLSQTGISIQDTGTNTNSTKNSISVSGEGEVSATPDIVNINAGISELGKTTKIAQESVNQKLNTILSILKEKNIPQKNIQTSNLTINPEYEWKEKDGRQLVGQKVRQTLSIKIANIDKDLEKAGEIIDALGEINGLELNSVNFDIEDKKELFTQAREKAFEKAKQKAVEYAQFGNVTLGNPISISDATIQYNPPIYSNVARMSLTADGGGSSSLPSGELDVTATVNVIFEIK